MSNYPVAYKLGPPVKRNRLSVLFRALLVIPHYIWAFFYAIARIVVVVIAWLAILSTGRRPAALYDFTAGFQRFSGHLTAYTYAIVDAYPPFDGGEHPEHPVQIVIPPPKPEHNRLKTFFRAILAIRSTSCSTSSRCGCSSSRSRSGSAACSRAARAPG